MTTLGERIQANAERLHVDDVTITRQTPAVSGTYDPVTLAHEPSTSTVWAGKGLVTIGDLDATTDTPGNRHRYSDDYRASLPAAAATAGIGIGDTLTIDGSEWAPDLTGATFVVTVVVAQTYRSRLRLGMERLTPGPRL